MHYSTLVCALDSRFMISPTAVELLGNELLAKLNESDRQRLAAHMMFFELDSKDILQPAGDDVVDTWIPCRSSLASFQLGSVDGDGSVEVALIGREGAIGGVVSNGSLPADANAVVRVGGPFFRLKTAALEQAKLDSLTLRHWFARYSDCLIAQVFQTCACNATHLLAAMAGTCQPQINITQEQLAETLGVGRTFLARVIRQLGDEGVITTGRGAITIVNRSALHAKACRCTELIENHYDVVLTASIPMIDLHEAGLLLSACHCSLRQRVMPIGRSPTPYAEC